jgi:small nuclear ribonucleoprotein (snRNP)-like protein
MSLIQHRLKEVMDQQILIVQTDGKAFKGKLVEFDDNFILLHDCLETGTKDVKWRSVMVPIPSPKDKAIRSEEGGITYGEREKKVAVLRKVMINIQQVMRMWLWDPEEYSPKEFEDMAIVTL